MFSTFHGTENTTNMKNAIIGNYDVMMTFTEGPKAKRSGSIRLLSSYFRAWSKVI